MTTRQRERYAYICHPKKRDLASYDSLEIAQRHHSEPLHGAMLAAADPHAIELSRNVKNMAIVLHET